MHKKNTSSSYIWVIGLALDWSSWLELNSTLADLNRPIMSIENALSAGFSTEEPKIQPVFTITDRMTHHQSWLSKCAMTMSQAKIKPMVERSVFCFQVNSPFNDNEFGIIINLNFQTNKNSIV